MFCFLFAYDHYINSALSCAGLVKVNEVDEAELAEVELAVIDNDGLASADDRGDQMRIGVVAAARVLAVFLCKFECLGAGMEVDALAAAGGHHLLADIDQVLLEGFKTCHGHIECAFLRDNRASGVMRVNYRDAVLHARLGKDLLDLRGDIVEGRDLIVGLNFKQFFEYHYLFSVFFKSSAARRTAAIISSIMAIGSSAFMMPEAAPAASEPAMMKS